LPLRHKDCASVEPQGTGTLSLVLQLQRLGSASLAPLVLEGEALSSRPDEKGGYDDQ